MKFDKADIFLRNYILISLAVLIPLGFAASYITQLGGGHPFLIPYLRIVVIVGIICIISYIAYKLKLKKKR